MNCIQSIGIGIMGSDNMLGTSKERVELLKAGVDIKIIEKLYLKIKKIPNPIALYNIRRIFRRNQKRKSWQK